MTTSSKTARARGQAIEQVAAQWLQQRGLRLIASNHHVKGGELDLIMQDADILVFVEVKHRKSSRYGHPLESVTAQKQQRLVRAARLYLAALRHPVPCRFDVVAMTGTPPDVDIEWVKAAFDAF